MPSGWTRWLFEQYEFPFTVIYPNTLGRRRPEEQIRRRRVLTDGAIRRWRQRRWSRGGGGFGGNVNADTVPDEYNERLGRISDEKSMPALKKFVESGGSGEVTIGSSTSIAEVFGIPVKNYLTEKGPDGKDRALPGEKFYIPGWRRRPKPQTSRELEIPRPGRGRSRPRSRPTNSFGAPLGGREGDDCAGHDRRGHGSKRDGRLPGPGHVHGLHGGGLQSSDIGDGNPQQGAPGSARMHAIRSPCRWDLLDASWRKPGTRSFPRRSTCRPRLSRAGCRSPTWSQMHCKPSAHPRSPRAPRKGTRPAAGSDPLPPRRRPAW